MYGIPTSFNSKILIGDSVCQICVGIHDYQINFESGRSITMQCKFQVGQCNDTKDNINLTDTNGVNLIRLVGLRVKNCEVFNEAKIRLSFENDVFIEIFDSNPDFESFSIAGKGINLIV